MAPALLVAQSFGRVGNYFNQELFGGPTRLPWGLQIDPSHRPPGYAQFATFSADVPVRDHLEPVAGVLVWLGRRRQVRAAGLFALYVAGYSGFRVFEETLRVDYSQYILGMRLNLFVAALLCLAGLLWFVSIQCEWQPTVRMPWQRARLRGALGDSSTGSAGSSGAAH